MQVLMSLLVKKAVMILQVHKVKNDTDSRAPLLHFFSVNGMDILFEANSFGVVIVSDAARPLLSGYCSDEYSWDNYSSNGTETISRVYNELEYLNKYFLSRKIEKNIRPFGLRSITLHVCHSCNMSCDYCYGNDGVYNDEGFMSEKIAIRAIDILLKNSPDDAVLNIGFFGGEPLLNFGVIKQTVEYIKQRRPAKLFSLHITTNGTLINDEIAYFLADNSVRLTISIDGDKRTHDKHRRFKTGKGTFDTIGDNLRRYPYIAEKCACRMTVTADNNDIVYLSKSINSLGIERVVSTFVTDNNGLQVKQNDCASLLSEFRNIVDLVRQNECSFEKVEKLLGKEYMSFLRIIKKYTLRIKSRKYKLRGCNAGISSLSVSPKGDVYTCHRAVGNNKFYLCNIFDDDIIKHAVDSISYDIHVDSIEECKRCWAKYLCGGMCYHENYSINNSFEPIQSRCEYRKKIIEMSIYLYALMYRVPRKQNDNNA